MKTSKRKRLEAVGWKVGSANDFLGLTPKEAAFVELKLTLARPNQLLDMMAATKVDSTPYAAPHLPFANELEMQLFVEKYAEHIFGLEVIASTRRGEGGLFKIDVLAVERLQCPFHHRVQVGPGRLWRDSAA